MTRLPAAAFAALLLAATALQPSHAQTVADSAKAAIGTSGFGLYSFGGRIGFGYFDRASAKPKEAPLDYFQMSNRPAPYAITDPRFGGVGDFSPTSGTGTDNSAAFLAAKAASTAPVQIPGGNFFASNIYAVTDHLFKGSGKIFPINAGNIYTGTLSWFTSEPTPGGSTLAGDNSRVEPEYWRLNTGLRSGLREAYNEFTTTPHPIQFFNYAGNSGTAARLSANAAVGDTMLHLNSVSDGNGGSAFAVGQTIAMFGSTPTSSSFVGPGSRSAETVTVTAIDLNANTLIISSALKNPYRGDLTSPIDSGVSTGLRTMNPIFLESVNQYGPGDSYAHEYRVTVGCPGTPGQDHVFSRCTGGIDGGDLIAETDHVEITGRETTVDDLGHDIMAIDDIRGMNRHNNTGADHAVWIHQYLTSGGPVPIDANWVAAGPAKVGLDLARADFSSNGQNAIGLGANQRIYFDDAPDASKITELWSSILGTHSMGFDQPNGRMAIWFGSTAAVSVYSTVMQTNGIIRAGTDFSADSGQRYRLDGPAGQAWLTLQYGHIVATINGGASYQTVD